MKKTLCINIVVLNFIASIILLSSCETDLGPDVITKFTYEDEKNLGEAIHSAMISSDNFNIMPASMDVNNYVKSVRTQLVGTRLMDRLTDFDWNIYVILNDDVLDCFTTVGGNIYIYSGLLKNIENESQFMSILAHEMFYADRSYHMDVLNNTYSFPILLDVSRGGDDAKAVEMLYSFYNRERDQSLVEEADAYGQNIICATQRPTNQFRVIIEGMEKANTLWYYNHKESNNTSFTNRVNNLKMNENICGADTENRTGPYSSFVNSLP
jgi:beta-barrel assembly-enhancing protease